MLQKRFDRDQTTVDPWLDFHRVLNQGLSGFLNADHQARLGKLLYPLVDRQQVSPWQHWRGELLDAVQELEQRATFPGISSLPLDVAGTAECLARVFAWALENYPAAYAEGQSFVSTPCLKRFDPETYRARGSFVAPVVQLWEYANHYLTGLITGSYLHGSLSTLDYVPGSSDLDTVLIVAQDTLVSPPRLLALRKHMLHMLRWFYQIDYSQHHGYMVLSDLDLLFYDDVWFPQVLFSIATVLVGGSEVKIRRRRVQPDQAEPFRQMCLRIHEVASGRARIAGWYTLKLHLQGILLLPTLYLQARGTPTYKRDSFDLVGPQVPRSAWGLIDKISRIRALGLQKVLISPWVDQQIAKLPTPWAASILHRWYRNQVPAVVWEILGNDWLDQSVRLTDALTDRLHCDGYIP